MPSWDMSNGVFFFNSVFTLFPLYIAITVPFWTYLPFWPRFTVFHDTFPYLRF